MQLFCSVFVLRLNFQNTCPGVKAGLRMRVGSGGGTRGKEGEYRGETSKEGWKGRRRKEEKERVNSFGSIMSPENSQYFTKIHPY